MKGETFTTKVHIWLSSIWLSFKNSVRDITLPGVGGSNTVSRSGRRLMASAIEIVEPGLYVMSRSLVESEMTSV